MVETKICSKCGHAKPLDEFSRDNKRKDGRQYRCKACFRKYREEKKERVQHYIETGDETCVLLKDRLCNKCGEPLILGVNWTEGNAKGSNYICRTCRASLHRAYRKANPESIRASERKRREKRSERMVTYQKAWRRANEKELTSKILWRTYGITLADYDAMLEAQGGGCAICGKTPEENGRRLCVDHNHETEEIRDLLCNSCNQALGGFQDSPELCRQAMLYLQRHEQ